VEISFSTSKLEKVFNSERKLKEIYGELAKTIIIRMAVLKNAPTLADVPIEKPDRRHELKYDRAKCFAVDLKQPFRLVFEPLERPIPEKTDGGVDVRAIRGIRILEIVDYH